MLVRSQSKKMLEEHMTEWALPLCTGVIKEAADVGEHLG